MFIDKLIDLLIGLQNMMKILKKYFGGQKFKLFTISITLVDLKKIVNIYDFGAGET